VLGKLDAQLERSEDRVAELETSQTALLTALREGSTREADMVARMGSLERDLEVRAAELESAAPSGPAASVDELEEVIAAVNDLVSTVDELSEQTGLAPKKSPEEEVVKWVDPTTGQVVPDKYGGLTVHGVVPNVPVVVEPAPSEEEK